MSPYSAARGEPIIRPWVVRAARVCGVKREREKAARARFLLVDPRLAFENREREREGEVSGRRLGRAALDCRLIV